MGGERRDGWEGNVVIVKDYSKTHTRSGPQFLSDDSRESFR